MNPACDLILASASPRRKELLQSLGVLFEVRLADVEEDMCHIMAPEQLTINNAEKKAEVVSRSYPHTWILGADTLVFYAGRALGKPRDFDDALQTLESLSGQTHIVCTGVCLLQRHAEKKISFAEITAVTFRALSRSAWIDYLAKIDYRDKAGSYAAQEYGDEIIEKVEGSWTNVVGLPIEPLTEILQTLHIPLTRPPG